MPSTLALTQAVISSVAIPFLKALGKTRRKAGERIFERKEIAPHFFKTSKAPIKQVYTDQELKLLLKKPKTSNFKEYRNWVIENYMLATVNLLSSIVSLNIEDIDLDS